MHCELLSCFPSLCITVPIVTKAMCWCFSFCWVLFHPSPVIGLLPNWFEFTCSVFVPVYTVHTLLCPCIFVKPYHILTDINSKPCSLSLIVLPGFDPHQFISFFYSGLSLFDIAGYILTPDMD